MSTTSPSKKHKHELKKKRCHAWLIWCRHQPNSCMIMHDQNYSVGSDSKRVLCKNIIRVSNIDIGGLVNVFAVSVSTGSRSSEVPRVQERYSTNSVSSNSHQSLMIRPPVHMSTWISIFASCKLENDDSTPRLNTQSTSPLHCLNSFGAFEQLCTQTSSLELRQSMQKREISQSMVLGARVLRSMFPSVRVLEHLSV